MSVNTAADLSRLIPPDLRAGVVWLIRLGCAQIETDIAYAVGACCFAQSRGMPQGF
jgi:hypothetical protein